MDRSSWSGSESPCEDQDLDLDPDLDRLSDSGGDRTLDGDPEGVWSPDIEQSFQEALAIYPPCGRRKIILSDEGKMYGRNELIARYIKLRTGKTRTRKQVSSHIQVLARRKSREFQSKFKDQGVRGKALQSISSMSSAQIVATATIHNKLLPGIVRAGFPGNAQLWQQMIPGGQSSSTTEEDIKPFSQQPAGTAVSAYQPPACRSIGTNKLRLVEFSSFLETQREQEADKHFFVHVVQNDCSQGDGNHGGGSHGDAPLECVDVRQIYDKFPEKKGGLKELLRTGSAHCYLLKIWADLSHRLHDDPSAFFGVTSQYESSENATITVSTKVCSFGKQVVEKVETQCGRFEDGRFVYRLSRSPMCEYMINFIHKLRLLPEKYMMNSVLENFTILLVVSNTHSQETLLVLACVFEVSTNELGAQHHVYRLVED